MLINLNKVRYDVEWILIITSECEVRYTQYILCGDARTPFTTNELIQKITSERLYYCQHPWITCVYIYIYTFYSLSLLFLHLIRANYYCIRPTDFSRKKLRGIIFKLYNDILLMSLNS